MELEFTIKKIEDKELKEKYSKDLWPECSEELLEELMASEFWAVLSENEVYALATAELGETAAKISHFRAYKKLYETDVSLLLYIQIEKYCIQKNIDHISVEIPAGIRGMSILMRNFFKKKALFDIVVQKIDSKGKFIVLIKSKLMRYYIEKDGKLIPNFVKNGNKR